MDYKDWNLLYVFTRPIQVTNSALLEIIHKSKFSANLFVLFSVY